MSLDLLKCIILSAHFLKKNTLKSNIIIYNSASRVIRTHVCLLMSRMSYYLPCVIG